MDTGEAYSKKYLKDNNLLSILSNQSELISIEICPGKQYDAEILSNLNPDFCSVPWFEKVDFENPGEISSIKLVSNLQEERYTSLMHLAGRNFRKEQITRVLDEVKNRNIRNIFVIQGNWLHVKEKSDSKCDFPYASDLVSFIRQHYGNYFCIGVAGYPDKHPHSSSKEEDLMFLKRKVESGADFIITQGIYEYAALESFIKSCRNLKIDVPILPGIFIANSEKTLATIKNICQVAVPDKVIRSYEILRKDPVVLEDFAVSLAVNLIIQIFDGKLCPGIHIFSLNNLEIMEKVISFVKTKNK